MEHKMIHRMVCAVCALALLATGLLPTAAFAAEPETEPLQTLTAADVREMQQADTAVTALTDSEAYENMTETQRLDAALDQLDDLVQQGLVKKGSVYADEENGMVSFSYTCGALGGILLTDPEEEDETVVSGPDFTDGITDLAEVENGAVGNAIIYYAFDNGINSSRYPYYAYMRNYWTDAGLTTHLDLAVTVSDLRKMGDYDLAILSAHGAYYTYQYGWLWKKQETAPIILLLEQSDFWTDLRYGMDLLSHRIIKVNGAYAVTGDFFRAAYRGGKLNNTMVLSETCEFYGRSGHLNTSLADGLLSGGAVAVEGYINNVYSVYSRSMLWATVNRLIEGETLQDAVNYSMEIYGDDDIVWYDNQMTGRRPHAVASYAILDGSADARLTGSGAGSGSTSLADAV